MIVGQNGERPRTRHNLAVLRDLECLTQDELAAKAKVSSRTISNIETHHCRPRAYIRRRLLDALGIPYRQHHEVFGPFDRQRDG